jgi:hypothetical protein
MKKSLLVLTVAGMILSPPPATAYSELLLEGFENGIDNVFPVGGRGDRGNVQLTHYTREDESDVRVTQGNHALKVELLNDDKWWSEDFMIVLNPEAAAFLKAAWDPHPDTETKPEARYLLKYDLTFPPSGQVAWMNQAIHHNWQPYQEWDSSGNDNAPVTISVPLDLQPGSLTLNEDGTADLRFINNADWADGTIPTFFLDNIRLVDQWTSEAPPVTTLIESFEDEWATFWMIQVSNPRTTAEWYSATDPDDPNVTEGSASLEVVMGQPQGWSQDFRIELDQSPGVDKLTEIMELPESERTRYTLRFDIIFQAMPEGGWGGGGWGYKYNTSLHTAGSSRMPSNRATYSINMATANLDPFLPAITFIGNGGYADEVVSYVDNIRVLDTQVPGPPLVFPPPVEGPVTPGTSPVFTSISVDAGAVTLTWEGEAGGTYRLVSSSDLVTWDTVVADNYPAGGAATATVSITVDVSPTEQAQFFRVSPILP